MQCYFEQDSIKLSVNNGGASGTTDWINSIGGIAQYWSEPPLTAGAYSIVTGNGFTGNAQRLEWSGIGVARIISNNFNLSNGTYKLRLKYRSFIDVSNFTVQLLNTDDIQQGVDTYYHPQCGDTRLAVSSISHDIIILLLNTAACFCPFSCCVDSFTGSGGVTDNIYLLDQAFYHVSQSV